MRQRPVRYLLPLARNGRVPAKTWLLQKRRPRHLREQIGLSRIVIHMKKGAAGATAEESAAVEGFFTPTPKIATGAGDHFNAGYLWAVCAGMGEGSALTVACATLSGHYVRTRNFACARGFISPPVGFLSLSMTSVICCILKSCNRI